MVRRLNHSDDVRVESTYSGFTINELDATHRLYVGELPGRFAFDDSEFEELWQLHPEEFHEIKNHGRFVKTPRWQQAYGKDYHYSGRVNKALEVPESLEPLLHWCQTSVDERLNGILLNWYDGSLGHYIGPHRDSTKNMCEGAPIVTTSLGQARVFRLRPWKGKGFRDFDARNGTVFVMPFNTNQAWTHEIPKAKRFQGRRISITLRAFS